VHDRREVVIVPDAVHAGGDRSLIRGWAMPTCFSPIEEIMNKDQVKGAIKDAAGKVQEKTGQVIGSTKQELKGIAKQFEGKAQKVVGDVKAVLKDVGHK
jgi:uncharacterized protein YjbJ (UPF0337 family)